MLTGLMTSEDEEEIMKELDELREQEVKQNSPIREYRTKMVNFIFFLS